MFTLEVSNAKCALETISNICKYNQINESCSADNCILFTPSGKCALLGAVSSSDSPQKWIEKFEEITSSY